MPTQSKPAPKSKAAPAAEPIAPARATEPTTSVQPPKTLKVTTLNVNGLRSAVRRGFHDWLQRSRPDVLCMQEIRCDEACVEPELWRPEGWQVAWHPAEKKGYAGTAVWARQPEARFSLGSGHTRGDGEGRVTAAHLPGPGAGLDVYSVYLPSGSSGPERQAWKFEFMEHFLPWLDGVLASGRPSLVCGDLNIAHQQIDLKNWRSNQKNSGFLPEERAWMTEVLGRGWRDVFRELYPERVAYSWWSNRGRARENDVGWRIDYLLATPGVRVSEVTIEREANLSDHAPVSALIEL